MSNNLEKMIEKMKKVSKDKSNQIQESNYRKLRIKEKKRPVKNKIEDDKFDRL